MDTIVVKFGGSSVANDEKLKIVANRIIDFHQQNNHVVVVISAQGKTTDHLLEEAVCLAPVPNERELDVLMSCGEQISMAKLAILLNHLGYEAISLTGWQAGIGTTNQNQNATICNIDTTRIEEEIKENKIVIIAGFQGINENGDITTLGRGGSDTTAVSIAAALKAKHCYIFSDVDGVYTSDPNRIKNAKKLETLSYCEMMDMANEGAKVLHNRSVEIAQKYHIPILARSTFKEGIGTVIQDKIEDTKIKSIVKNDDILLFRVYLDKSPKEGLASLLNSISQSKINIGNYRNESNETIIISFTIKNSNLNKMKQTLDNIDALQYVYNATSRISIIGNGIYSNHILEKVLQICNTNMEDILQIENSETKISITFKYLLSDEIANKLHDTILLKS